MHPNYEDTRRLYEQHTLAALAQHHSPEEMKAVEPLIKEYIATTITDDFLFQDFNRMAAEKRAKEAKYWEAYHAADAAKKAAAKVTRDHEDALARKNDAIKEAEQETEMWQRRAKGLDAQITGLLKGQRT